MTYTQITREERYDIHALLRLGWTPAAIARRLSPEQIVGPRARVGIRTPRHETILRHIWKDRKAGGTLWTHLRLVTKNLRQRYGTYDRRGRLAGKRQIATRPAGATHRWRLGH